MLIACASRILLFICATLLDITSCERPQGDDTLGALQSERHHVTSRSDIRGSQQDSQRRVRVRPFDDAGLKLARCENEVTAEWLSILLASLWPNINTALEKLMHAILPSQIDNALKGFMGTMAPKSTVRHFNLGSGSPVLGAVSVCQDQDENGMELQVDISFDSNAGAGPEGDTHIEIAIGKVVAGIKSLSFSGTLLLKFDELLEEVPLVGGLSVALLDPPELDFKLIGIGKLAHIPKVDNLIKNVIGSAIAGFIVLPNRFSIPIANPIQNAGFSLHALRHPLPEGILRVVPKRASGLPVMNGWFGRKGSPYVQVELSNEKWKSTTKQGTDPTWDDEDADQADLLCWSRQKQLKLSLWDNHGMKWDDEYVSVSGTIQEFLADSAGRPFEHSWQDASLQVDFKYFVADPSASFSPAAPQILVVKVDSVLGKGKVKFTAEIPGIGKTTTPEAQGIKELVVLDQIRAGVYKRLAASKMSREEQLEISGLSPEEFKQQEKLSAADQKRSQFSQADLETILYLSFPAKLLQTATVKLSIVEEGKEQPQTTEMHIRDVRPMAADAKGNPRIPTCHWMHVGEKAACVALSLLPTRQVDFARPMLRRASSMDVLSGYWEPIKSSHRSKTPFTGLSISGGHVTFDSGRKTSITFINSTAFRRDSGWNGIYNVQDDGNLHAEDGIAWQKKTVRTGESAAESQSIQGNQPLAPAECTAPESTAWLNYLLGEHGLGPKIEELVKKEIGAKVGPAIGAIANTVVQVSMKRSIGKAPLTLGAVRLCRGSIGHSLKIQFPFKLESDVNLKVKAKHTGELIGLKNMDLVGVKDLKIEGDLVIALAQLIEEMPVVGGITIGFANRPLIDYKLSAIATIPGIKKTATKQINRVLNDQLVIPNRLVIPIAQADQGVDFAEMRRPAPLGILLMSRPSALGLDVQLANELFDSLEPYFSASLGMSHWDTEEKPHTTNAVWEEQHGFVFWDYEEKVNLAVKDVRVDVASVFGSRTIGKTAIQSVQELLELSHASRASYDAGGRPLDGTWVPDDDDAISFSILGDSMSFEDGKETYLSYVSNTTVLRKDEGWTGTYTLHNDGKLVAEDGGVWQRKTCDNVCGTTSTEQNVGADDSPRRAITFRLDEGKGKKFDHVSSESCVSGCKAVPWSDNMLNVFATKKKCRYEVPGGHKVSVASDPADPKTSWKLCCHVLPCQPNRPGEIAMPLKPKGKLRLTFTELGLAVPAPGAKKGMCLLVLKLGNIVLPKKYHGQQVKVVASTRVAGTRKIKRETNYAEGVRSRIKVNDMYRDLIDRMVDKGYEVNEIAYVSGLSQDIIEDYWQNRGLDMDRRLKGEVDLDSVLYFLLPEVSGTIKLKVLVGDNDNKIFSGEVSLDQAVAATEDSRGLLEFPEASSVLKLDSGDSKLFLSLSYAATTERQADPSPGFVG